MVVGDGCKKAYFFSIAPIESNDITVYLPTDYVFFNFATTFDCIAFEAEVTQKVTRKVTQANVQNILLVTQKIKSKNHLQRDKIAPSGLLRRNGKIKWRPVIKRLHPFYFVPVKIPLKRLLPD